MEAITISPTPRSPASPHPDTHRNRQKRVGLVLVSGASTGIPLYYKIYPGGVPQVGFYEKGVDDLLTKVSKVGATVKDITFIFPHGIDHQSAIKRLDSQERLRFIASEAPVLSPELANIPLKDYRPLPCKANQRLIAAGEEENQILYYETRLHSWGRSRRAIITFNPKTFQKKYQDLRTKVQKLRKEFLAVQKNYHPGEGKGEDLQAIRTHLGQFCHRLNLNPALFQVGFQEEGGLPAFQLDHAQVESTVRQFGKDILITDHEDWEAPEICRVYLERCVLEVNGNHGSRFNHDLDEARDSVQVSLMPLYHWTDSKIRIHVFACVVALTYLAMLNQRLTAGGLLISLKEAMEELRYLRSAIHVVGPEGKLKRILEKVTDTQLAILQALGFHVQEGNVAPF